MKSRWKTVSIISGIAGLCCIIAAGLFAFYNMYDDSRAASDLKAETEQLEALILSPARAGERTPAPQADRVTLQQPTNAPILVVPENTETPTETPVPDPEAPQTPTPEPTPEPTPVPQDMPVVTIDGSDFVAILSIPALDLEFSIRNEWTKEGGKKSPCRYVGSVYTDDLILCAHNYTSHFGRLKELQQGDEILLVDMNGVVYTYHVDTVEQIDKFDVTGMVSSGYPLSLFTCTIGGKARVTVRCLRDS